MGNHRPSKALANVLAVMAEFEVRKVKVKAGDHYKIFFDYGGQRLYITVSANDRIHANQHRRAIRHAIATRQNV